MTLTLKSDMPQLVVMLTHNDLTVENAEEVFEKCKDSRARFWGMKEKPLSPLRMKALFSRMKECGKTTALEVVAYDEPGAMQGARLAVECGCDILMGTKFHPQVAEFCHGHVDLLGYRYVGDAVALNKTLVESLDAPVCIAGSIDSTRRLDEVKDAAPWAFTIGSAFFEGKFPGSFSRQIDYVCHHMERR